MINKYRFFLGFVLLAFMISGCNQLHVNVDIYRGPIPRFNSDADKLAQKVLNYEWFKMTMKQRKEAFEKKQFENVDVNSKEWQKFNEEAEYVRQTTLKLRVKTALNEENSLLLKDAAEDYQELRAALYNHVQNPYFRYVREVVKSPSEEPKKDNASQNPKNPSTPADQKNPSSTADQKDTGKPEEKEQFISDIAASEEVDGKHVGYPLFDPRIAILASGGGEWSNFVSNDFGSYMGTSQFVVVREGLVVFHLKSLDFDPSLMIAAGKATAKLGLKIGSALATGVITGTTGIPIKLPVGQGKDTAAATTPESSENKETVVFNQSEILADKNLLERRQKAKIELLRDMANLYDSAEKMDEKNISKDKENLSKKFNSSVKFFQGRLNLHKLESEKK